MSLFHIGFLLYLVTVIFLKVSSAVYKECSGIYCYNGGSLSFEKGLCVCHCPPNATGLLCGQEMKTSMWPSGPYAVPMVRDGCPEESDRGWKIGHIKITTINPMSETDSYNGCKNENYKYQTDVNLPIETYANIAGYFDTYVLQINLCYKLPEYTSNFGISWLSGNYSIYGVNHECPTEFYAKNVTVCIPPIQTLEHLETLPVFTVESFRNHTNLTFTICTRRPEETLQRAWNVEYPFSFLKLPDKKCQDISEYESSRSMLSSFVPMTQRLLLSEEPLMFCLYKPKTYIIGAKSDYWKNNNDTTLRTILKDYFATMYVSLSLEDISCEFKPKGFSSRYCGEMQKLTIDAKISVEISGIFFQFDSVISQYRFRRKRAFLDIFTSDQRIITSISSDSVMCSYNEYSWENSETDLIVVLLCNRVSQARYITIYTPDDILSNTFVTILSQLSTNASETSVVESDLTSCYSDMGMSDFRIQDFQLEASTSQIGHEPHQARPHYNGWCAESHDLHPYLQIDFISAFVIDGIILYSWIAIEKNMYHNVYNYSLREYGRQSFILEYAVSKETFIRFNPEPLPIDLSHAIDEPHTYLFKTSFLARYIRVYSILEDYKLTTTCLKLEILGCRGAMSQSQVYFDLFIGNLLNVFTSEVMVNNSFPLASSNMPATDRENQVFRWNIFAMTARFLLLQFTDISLRPAEKGQTFKNYDFCEDILIVIRNENPTRKVSGDLNLGFGFVFDYRYNGRFPTIPVQYLNVALEFRSCMHSQNNQEYFRGFSVIIFEKDTNPPCFQEQLCLLVPSILGSPSFLGQLLEPETVYTWTFIQVIEPNTVFRVLDFDVSCSSGTKFIIRDFSESTRTIYCNKNRTYDVIPTRSNLFTIEFSTERKSCGQVFFREGFRLLYEKLVEEKSNDLQQWTTYKLDIKENQPVWIVYITFPEQMIDILEQMPYNGMIRKECSLHFNKCYKIYIGLPDITVHDAMRLCADRNSTLVNFKTKLEMEYVRGIVLQRVRDIGILAVETFYENLYLLIGLLRYTIGNKYRSYWSDGSLVDFTAWDENEPNNNGRRLCTVMKLTANGGWKTENCAELFSQNIVCEQLMTSEVNSSEGHALAYEIKSTENNHTLTYFEHLMFACNNGEFVSRLARCNGVGECTDNSDEEECLDDDKCEEDEFKCDKDRCVHVSQVCDHVNDCNDFTDEACIYKPCKPLEFMCDGDCHPNLELCDTIKHCKDGSDEMNCESHCGVRYTSGCGSSKVCLPEIYTCNGVIDCQDGSDEYNCKSAIKTCDDFLISTAARSGLYKSDGNYINCVFDIDFNSNRTFQNMTFLNVDWSFQKKAEYKLEPHEFILFALQNDYTCSQKFTQESRRDNQIVNNLLNKTDYDWEEIVLNLTLLESNPTYFPTSSTSSSSSTVNTDTFEVIFTEHNLQLSFNDNFDIENNRIRLGPIQCYKESSNILTIPCGEGVRPVTEDMRCVYDVDSEFNVLGCVNLNHLENCTEFVCPDKYVKCPRSYCILPHKICDGFMDCPHGEDEEECWCEDDKRTLVIFVNMFSEDEFNKRACKLAGEFYSRRRTVLLIWYRHDILNYIFAQVINSKSGHCLFYDTFQYSVALYTDYSKWDTWPFQTLKKFHKTFHNSKSNALIWMTKSEINEHEQAISNFIKKYMESFDGYVTVYNIRADPTIGKNIKVVPSVVTEILVRNWDVVDAIGPWLLKDDCTGISKVSCRNGYICIKSRVCIQIEQLCDGREQCPHGDDERNCNFLCPSFCSCGLLTMKCKETNKNLTLFYSNIHVSTRNLDLSGTDTYGKNYLNSLTGAKSSNYLLSLNVSNCKITTLSYSYFFALKNLRTLDLSHNRIKRLTEYVFLNLTHLSKLYLHGNSLLSYIKPGAFHGLKINSLDLTGCGLLSISANTFSDLTLNDIDLSFNKIDKVEDLAFNKLSVRHLKLQANRINVFSKKMFEGLMALESLNTPGYKFCCIRPVYLKEDSCLPFKDEFSSCADLMRNPILQALLWIIGCLALLGNISSLVYRIYFREQLKIGYGIFVTNLAVSDMFMGVYMLIIAVADSLSRGRYIEIDTYWRSSDWCRLAGALSTMSSEASVFFIAFITIDRILVIKFPFGNIRLSARKAIVVSVVIWVFCTVLSVLPLLYVEYFSDSFYSRSAVCLALPLTRDRPPGWIYSISVFVGFNFVMFVLIAAGQLLIYTEIKKQTKVNKRMNVKRRNDLVVARNLLMLVSTDFMCWFPIGCMGLMAMNGYVIQGDVYAWTAVLVLPINSALNPFLYTLSAIMNRKSFNPNIDEQQHENWKKASARIFVQIYSYFFHGNRRELGQNVNLSNIFDKRRLVTEEVLLVSLNIAKGLSVLHDENLVMKNFDRKTVGIGLSSNFIRKAYFNQPPHILRNKRENAEDIYHFGILIRECIQNLCGSDENK